MRLTVRYRKVAGPSPRTGHGQVSRSVGRRHREVGGQARVGTKRDDVRDGCRVLFVGSYAVYYTATPDAVRITRVLHGRIDPDRHLE